MATGQDPFGVQQVESVLNISFFIYFRTQRPCQLLTFGFFKSESRAKKFRGEGISGREITFRSPGEPRFKSRHGPRQWLWPGDFPAKRRLGWDDKRRGPAAVFRAGSSSGTCDPARAAAGDPEPWVDERWTGRVQLFSHTQISAPFCRAQLLWETLRETEVGRRGTRSSM